MVGTFDLCPTAILVFEIENFGIVAANAAAARQYGYSKEDLSTMTIMDLRPPEEVPRIAALASRIMDGPDAAGRSRHLNSEGEEFITEVTTQVVEMNGRLCKLAVIHDVTQQVEQEEKAHALSVAATQRSREADATARHFAELFNLAPGRCAIVTPGSFEVVAVSDRYLDAVGMQRAGVIGQPLLGLLAGLAPETGDDPAGRVRESLDRAARTGQDDVIETTGLAFDLPAAGNGSAPDWSVVHMPLKGPDGVVEFVLHCLLADPESDTGTPEDADARELHRALSDNLHGLEAAKLSQRLAEREALLRTTRRLLKVHVWRFDVDRQRLEWTDDLFALFGLPLDTEAPTFDAYVAMVHPEDRDAMIANFEAFMASPDQEFAFAHRIVRPDGQVIYLKGAAERMFENGRTVLSGVVQDVTEEARTRAKAERRDYLVRVAGGLGNIGGWRVDLESRIVEWSPEVARIHEIPETRQVGLQRGLDFYPPEYRDRIAERFNACAEDGTPFDEILQIVTARGNRVWIRVVGEADRDAGGRIVAVIGAFQDLSEVVRIDEERQALRDRLGRTLERMGDAFFTLDPKWRFTYVNQQCEALLRRTRAELLGRNVWSEFPEAAGSRFETEYHHAVESGESVEFSEYFPPLDTWFRVTAHPSSDGLAVYFRDVTRDRLRDQSLRMLNAAVTRMDDILLITEASPIDAPDGPRITYVNSAFERLTGYSAEEAIGQTPRFLQGPETQKDELDRIRAALEQQEHVRAEIINYARDGQKYWIEMDITPLTDAAGKTTHYVALQRDVTEGRKWIEDLRVSEERFRLVTNASKDVIWDWDVRTGSLWWSDKLRTVFGYDPGTTPALASDITACVHPDDAEKVRSGLGRLVEGRKDVWQEEYRFLRADGRVAYIRDRAIVLRDDDGAAMRVIGSMVDVTQEREREAILRHSQKLDAIGQLTGGVAHDFNNLLTVMLNNGDFLVEKLTEREDLRAMAEQIVGAAERGAELTARLLAVARQQPLSPQVTDLNEVVRSIEPLLRRTLGEDMEMEVMLTDDLWLVEIDPGQLEGALLNLTLNARDAMPSGGKLTVETANAWIDAGTASLIDMEEGPFAVVAVTDTGVGMSSQVRDRVLEPFFTTKAEGSGLGLPMVFGFTRQSHGHLKVYSEQGEGTTIKLFFPRSAAREADMSGAPGITEVPAGQGEHILVVEDDPHVRQNVVTMVASLGYRVTAATNAGEALDVLEGSDDIALLFTDIVMPGGMNGHELALAARERRPDLRVLYTSGYTKNAIVHQGRLDPGVDLLSKPYRSQDLAQKLHSVLTDRTPRG
ncbi:PAS domain S-box protein [Roseovarius ramblicola]|uniref:histidine kinase n=2 Tax=Roseovarius ramblicola TaxID=2022336 RepID=A0ABV5I3Z8_9RHOB